MLLRGFQSRLGLESSGCSMWHFWSSSPGVFFGNSGFLPSFIGLMVQPIKQSSNKCDFNSVKLNSWAVNSYQVARNMTLARDKRSMCCTWFPHDCPGPLERTCWRRFAALWGDCKKKKKKKISNSAFERDYYYYYPYYYYYYYYYYYCILPSNCKPCCKKKKKKKKKLNLHPWQTLENKKNKDCNDLYSQNYHPGCFAVISLPQVYRKSVDFLELWFVIKVKVIQNGTKLLNGRITTCTACIMFSISILCYFDSHHSCFIYINCSAVAMVLDQERDWIERPGFRW